MSRTYIFQLRSKHKQTVIPDKYLVHIKVSPYQILSATDINLIMHYVNLKFLRKEDSEFK